MIYKVKMMSGEDIAIENEEALKELLKQANEGKKLIVTKYGIVNVSSIDSIVRHKELMGYVSERVNLGMTRENAEKEQLGESPFKLLIGDEYKKLK